MHASDTVAHEVFDALAWIGRGQLQDTHSCDQLQRQLRASLHAK